jgi:multidrug efflux pump subunit AcrA (membrane-fusion protein)
MESVFTDRDSTSSISIAKEGRSKKISVTPGLRDGDRIEVKGEGLAAGMQVITTGSYALPDGTKILAREASTKGGGDR